MVDLASQALSDAAKEAAVLLCSPGTDTFLEDLTRNVGGVFYFDDGGLDFIHWSKRLAEIRAPCSKGRDIYIGPHGLDTDLDEV